MCGVDSAATVEYPLPLLPILSCDIYAIDSRKALPFLMAFMKNAFIRALNHAYTISMRLPSGDPKILHFLMYAKSVVELLQVHLEGDRLFFTTCSDGRSLTDVLGPDCYPDFSGVTEALITLGSILAHWTEVPSTYSSSILQEHLHFGLSMVSHMRDQVEYLTFERISVAISDDDLHRMIQANIEWLTLHSDMSFLLPFVISHHDPSTSSYWPPVQEQGIQALPTLLKAHEGCWQFAPFDPLTRLPVVMH
ncbi:hypothetical protein EV401DRAFT_2278615 [Pisolithus croceorrhizus]|nr:hypothetical protein EV401DRAFT_2278615 [Pisolithus croceorrhizus]